MVEEYVEVLRHVKERHRLAMMLVGHGAVFELYGAAFRKEGDAHYIRTGWLSKVDDLLRILF